MRDVARAYPEPLKSGRPVIENADLCEAQSKLRVAASFFWIRRKVWDTFSASHIRPQEPNNKAWATPQEPARAYSAKATIAPEPTSRPSTFCLSLKKAPVWIWPTP